MRDFFQRALVCVLALTACSAAAQMHKVAKPEQVVRAVGVYEWTGDFTKPNASRLIPVSLSIDGKFQDAGIYLARPVPFALLSGNVYELQSAGMDKGLLDLVYARHLEATNPTGDLAYDDGWFGYGKVQPLAVPRRAVALKASKNLPVLQSSVKDSAGGSTVDADRPTMKRRDSSGASSTGASSTTATPATTASSTTPADDPDRPVMKRRDTDATDSSGKTTSGASSPGGTPDADPDRPTMSRRGADSSGSSTTAGSPDPSSDPDRPTLKRRTPEEARKARNANEGPSTTGYNSLNNDPDRPNLHYGKPTHALTETELPKLAGLPQNMRQMIAVSDAVDRDPHSFALAWDDPAQRAAILAKMQGLAQAQLAGYGKPAAAATAQAKTAARKTSPARSQHTGKPAGVPPPALEEEELNAYTLSYGGDPTYVYSAHTAGTGAALRYVTIVAQSDSLGQFKPAIESVTDAAHLEERPRMRFVDAVDAEASNRASLLFELRGQSSRQFGLYRVIAGHSDQIFVTGTTQ